MAQRSPTASRVSSINSRNRRVRLVERAAIGVAAPVGPGRETGPADRCARHRHRRCRSRPRWRAAPPPGASAQLRMSCQVHRWLLPRGALPASMLSGPKRRLARSRLARPQAAMPQFDPGQRAVAMHGLGHRGHVAHIAIVPERGIGGGGVVRTGMDRAIFGVHHAPAAFGLDPAHGRQVCGIAGSPCRCNAAPGRSGWARSPGRSSGPNGSTGCRKSTSKRGSRGIGSGRTAGPASRRAACRRRPSRVSEYRRVEGDVLARDPKAPRPRPDPAQWRQSDR
jgi:hypothetical protein